MKKHATQPKTREKMAQLQAELSTIFPEREHVVRGFVTAILARQHVFLIGPPGTAKSALVETLRFVFTEKGSPASFFSYLMTKFTEPNELFGPYDYNKFMSGNMTRVTDGYLPSAQFVFLDELFKSSSAILNSLLMALDERRRLTFGNTTIELPMELCVGASNEYPQGEELAALYDRFVIKFQVDYLKDDTNFTRLIETISADNRLDSPDTRISMSELKEAQAEVDKVSMSKDALSVMSEIRNKLNKERIAVSDRRWVQCIRTLKATAWLDGSSTIQPKHCEILVHVLWSNPENIDTVRTLVIKMCDPVSDKIYTSLNKVLDSFNKCITGSDKSKKLEVNQQILVEMRMLIAMYKESITRTDKVKLSQAISFANDLNQRIANSVMGTVVKGASQVNIAPYKMLESIKDGTFAQEIELSEDDLVSLIKIVNGED